jgi:hypothetical protein
MKKKSTGIKFQRSGIIKDKKFGINIVSNQGLRNTNARHRKPVLATAVGRSGSLKSIGWSAAMCDTMRGESISR